MAVVLKKASKVTLKSKGKKGGSKVARKDGATRAQRVNQSGSKMAGLWPPVMFCTSCGGPKLVNWHSKGCADPGCDGAYEVPKDIPAATKAWCDARGIKYELYREAAEEAQRDYHG